MKYSLSLMAKAIITITSWAYNALLFVAVFALNAVCNLLPCGERMRPIKRALYCGERSVENLEWNPNAA